MASVGYSPEERFQPSAKLLNKTASTGFSYLNRPTRQQQQHMPAMRSLSSGQSGYNSLPRPGQRQSENAPSNLTQARRKLVNSAIQDYLKSLNAMTRSIVLETETVEKENHGKWKKMDSTSKDNLVDDHFMPVDVRMQYEHERAASCCSFSSGWSDRGSMCQSQQACRPAYEDRHMERDPRHLSQPEEWEDSCRQGISRSHRELCYSESTDSNREELSLSQPSLAMEHPHEIIQPSNFNRLHKKQLSFRPHKQHAVKPQHSPAQAKYTTSNFRTNLGSDGESPRTSDEDFEGGFAPPPPQNPLGFQRSKLRSYSMRSRKGGAGAGSLRNTANLRSSVRNTHRIRNQPEGEGAPAANHPADPRDQHCRPSHYHSYSNTSTDNTDFDEAVDLPDEGLMLDHVTRKSSTEETDIDDDYELEETLKYTRASRRSFRNVPAAATPKITLEQTDRSTYRDSTTDSTTSFTSSSEAFLDIPDICSPSGLRPPSGLSSRESLLDMDSVSMAPSDMSKYPMDDEESMTDQSRMTPDSILSLSSSYSCRPRSKMSEIAILRNRRGKRGGSHIQVATSEFADRHTQFKNNMLQKHQLDSCQTSAATTRATSPASSIASSHHHQEGLSRFLKAPPTFSYTSSKHDSVAESTTSDLPSSPDQLSVLSSPPVTPVHVGQGSQLRKTLSSTPYEHRESGYISCSSESFQVASRR